MWHKRSCLCEPNSCGTATLDCAPILLLLRAPYFRCSVAFSDLTLALSLKAWGYWIPYPLPWSPFLKDLDDSSPCLPICSRCKQRHLAHSSPFHPQFHAEKHKTQRIPPLRISNGLRSLKLLYSVPLINLTDRRLHYSSKEITKAEAWLTA